MPGRWSVHSNPVHHVYRCKTVFSQLSRNAGRTTGVPCSWAGRCDPSSAGRSERSETGQLNPVRQGVGIPERYARPAEAGRTGLPLNPLRPERPTARTTNMDAQDLRDKTGRRRDIPIQQPSALSAASAVAFVSPSIPLLSMCSPRTQRAQ